MRLVCEHNRSRDSKAVGVVLHHNIGLFGPHEPLIVKTLTSAVINPISLKI